MTSERYRQRHKLTLKITKMKTVYQVSQKFSTEKETEELLTKYFDNYQDAKDHFEEIKDETQQGGDIVTDLQKIVYGENDEIDWSLTDMDLETFCNPYNYEEHYGKLVVMYMHTGKGMNYSHKFLDAFFLDKRSERRISENPDRMFTAWTTITELKAEDLEGLTYDEAVERVENEVNLKLTNRIDLSNLDLNFVNNED